MGAYDVGFYDTVIVDTNQSYGEYGFDEGRPFFVNIWHPLIKLNQQNYMTYGDLRKRDLEGPIAKVYEQLQLHMDSAFTWYNVAEDFVKYKEINYKGLSPYEVQKEVKNIETRSIRKRLPGYNDFPVIFYHHGAQGLSDENYVMAEYFASHGFIFVSANFHWPYQGHTFGYSPNWKYNTDAARFFTSFLETLSVSDEMYFIGHSWGAQTGFSFLYEDNPFEAFVSLETTLEFGGEEKIKETWNRLHKIMQEHQGDYKIPILMFANGGKKNDFEFKFFQQIQNAPMIHASTIKEFGHESYTSIYTARYFYRKKFKQPDTGALKKQLQLYAKHLNLIHSFIYYLRGEMEMPIDVYREDFYLKEYNRD